MSKIVRKAAKEKFSKRNRLPQFNDLIKLKAVKLKQDKALRARFFEEIEPIEERHVKKYEELTLIIEEAINKGFLPAEAIQHCEKYIFLNEYPWKLTDESLELKSRCLKICSEFTRLKNEYYKRIRKFENDYHVIYTHEIFRYGFMPLDPVVFSTPPVVFLEMIYDEEGEIEMCYRSGKLPSYILEEEFLDIRIDLTYDKTLILQKVDDILIKAQKLIGKYPVIGKRKDSKSIDKNKIVENLFMDYYVNKGLSKNETLEKITSYLEQEKFPLEPESINRKYIPNIKRKYGVKDIRELRNIKKGDK